VDVGNVNAGWTEGIVQALKKVERPDGETHPYISGQAMRHYIRSTMSELLDAESSGSSYGKFSPISVGGDRKAPVVTEGKPRENIDDDMFGFMNASQKGTWKREAPLRVSPAYGIFPYHRDRDLGTRSAVEEKRSAEAGGSIFETEITNNVFRCTLLLELDRIGRWKSFESVDNKEGELSLDVRKKRMKLLLSSLKYLWGGGRRTRLLANLTPQFIVYARMTKKVPIFLTSLSVSYKQEQYALDTKAFREIISDYKNDTEKLIVGVRSGFLANEQSQLDSLADTEAAKTLTIVQAVDSMINDIDSSDFGA
jgi:CRISPR-associated protein Cst2